MTEETVRGIISILWVVGILVFYAFLCIGVVRLLRWLGSTISAGVKTSRYHTMRAEGKSDAEIEATLDEPLLEKHWWVLPVASVVIVTLILPPGGIILGLFFLIRLAVQWPYMQEEMRERARLRAERAARYENQAR